MGRAGASRTAERPEARQRRRARDEACKTRRILLTCGPRSQASQARGREAQSVGESCGRLRFLGVLVSEASESTEKLVSDSG
ncbi:hypothetical protein ACFFQF_15615 [Haladaptatus pallidirubidus]|uniref:hypothetical protein n=1 Tax=Haladaptatus pallidirubidus TaxID=1008152 RepID=UPI0035E6D7D5